MALLCPPRRPVDPVFILLVVICVLCCAYFTVPDEHKAEEPTRKSARDLDWEHRLGAHAKDNVWGCRACQERK